MRGYLWRPKLLAPKMDFRSFWTTFRKTLYFRVAYLALVSVLVAFMLTLAAVCFFLLLVPVVMLLVPYWFGERSVKNHALNGLLVIPLSAVLFGVILTPGFTSAPQTIQETSDPSARLGEGKVVPFHATPGEPAEFTFTVNLRSTSLDSGNVTVRVQVVDWIGLQFVRRSFPMAMDGRGDGVLANGEGYVATATLEPVLHGFNFQVLTVVNTTETVVVQTNVSAGPFNAAFVTYYGFFLYQGIVTMVLIGLFFYIVLGIYWWTRKAREIRGALGTRRGGGRKRAEGGGEFTCTNCGGDVSEADTKCPNCGAEFVSGAEGESAQAKA